MTTHLTLRGRGSLLAIPATLCIMFTGSASAADPAPPAMTGAKDPGVTLAGAGKTETVRYGKRIRIAGDVSPASAGQVVRLQRAIRGRGYSTLAKTTTTPDGSYAFSVRARRSAAYRAVAGAGATASAPRRVTVLGKLGGRTKHHVLGVSTTAVKGVLRPGLRGRVVRLQQRTRGGWRTLDRARTRSGGRFRAAFRPRSIGTYRLRVRFAGDDSAAAAGKRLGKVNVYRTGHASWYGPGLYGNTTACGGALTPGRLGVAHKYLPCGTKVTFRYRGRSVTAPVIDRGPFIAGREWDLTAATKARLGFGGTGTVWSTK